ncbi:MAG: hypothetical protein U1F26_01290 [Lysobacterales bacterium]
MKYRGHVLVKSAANQCPKCGFWLEWTENVDVPVPGMLKNMAIAGVSGGLAWFFFGVSVGLLVAIVVVIGVDRILVPAQPDFYCFSCKSHCFREDLLKKLPKSLPAKVTSSSRTGNNS